MKKTLFTFVFLLALATGGMLKAQSGWIPSEAAAGTYYLYNVGKQAFLTGGNDWDTRATLNSYGAMPVTLISSGTSMSFYISTAPTYTDLYLGSDGYVDKLNTSSKYTPWIFTPVEGMTNVYTMKTTNDNTYLYGRPADTKTSVGASFSDNWGYWMLITKENMINYLSENASADNPVDATFALQNAKIGRVSDVSCWQGSPAFNGVDGNWCFEKYNTTFDVYQEVEGMPNGIYKLNCQGFYRMGGRTNAANNCNAGTESLNAFYYINDSQAPLKSIFSQYSHYSAYDSNYNENTAYTINGTTYYIPNSHKQAAYCCLKDDYWNEPIQVVVTDGKLRIGVKKTVAVGSDWTIFDNFVLTYYGVDISSLLEAKKAQWEKYKVISNQALDHSAFDAVLAAADDYCTTEAKIDEYDGILWNALCELLKNQTTATGQFDITSLIKNPTFDSSAAEWTTDGTVGCEPKYGVAEFFGQGDVSLSQTLANMPAGDYTLKVQSFFRSRSPENACKQYEAGTDVVSASLFMGDESTTLCNIFDQARYVSAYPSWDWGGAYQRSTPNTLHGAEEAFLIGQYWNILNATTSADGDINIGLRITGGSTSCWVPFDNFRLYYGATKIPVSLVSADGLTITDDTYADVTSDITLTAGEYNKVCLPFNLDETQTADIFDNVYTLAGVNEGVGQLIPATSLKAGQAYFVTVDATKQLSVDNVRICVAKPDSIPVMWEGAATVGKFEGFTFDVNPSDGQAITSYEPVDWQNMSFTVNQENWRARRFLSEVTYTDDMASQITYFDVAHPMRLDQPHSVFIPVPQNNSQLTVTISKNSDYSEPETFNFDAGATLCEVPNLIPQNTYYYKVESSGAVLTKGQFNTEGHVRMIKASSSFNIRDLGGRETIDGKRVRYGKVFRGGELNYGHTISEADKAELLRLGIGAEIDWRRDDETDNENPTVSALGNDVPYLYMNMDYADLGYAYNVNQQKFKQAFNFTLDNLRDEKAVYFHCRIGADRTGAFALLLEGLCGLTFDQLVKDYELTSYSEAGTRPWDDAASANNMIVKYQYIKSLPGNNLQEKFFYYCNTILGIPAQDLIDFIKIMVGEDCSITNSDLSFMNQDGSYIQDSNLLKAICKEGSTIASGAKAIISNGEETKEIDMSIDQIFISFNDVQLVPASEYTLTIPQGAIMKDGVENASEVTLSFKTPCVFDGDYYIYNEEHDQFISRGRNWGTRCVLDDFGIPATITTDINNTTTIKFLDNNLYLGEDNGVYSDIPESGWMKWNLIPASGGFTLFLPNYETNDRYFTISLDETYNYYFGRVRTTADAEPTVLTVKTKEEHQDILARKKLNNILSAANAAGISANSLNELETTINDNYSVKQLTNVIKSANAGSKTDWVLIENDYARNEELNSYNVGNYGGELYLKNAIVSQTVTVPHAGLYKLTLNAFFREGTNELCYAAGEKGFEMSNAYISVNNTYYAQVPDWYSDRVSATNPNNVDEAKALMDAGKYSMEVYAYIDDSKTATISVNVPDFIPFHWCIFNNWAIYEYVPNVIISENDEMPAEPKDIANVTLQRTLQPDILNTFCVPFSLTSYQIASSDLKDATIYQYGSSTDCVINYEPTTTIEAGKPYIVKLAEGSESIVNPEFKNVTIVSTEGETVGDDDTKVRFVGQPYYNKSINEQYPYVHYITTAGESKRLKNTGTIKGLRAYYLVPDTSANDVKAYFNDIASGIDEINGENISAEESIFDLSGRRINKGTSLMPGIYIVNGKKVMINQ